MSIECEGGWSGEECLLVGATVMRNGPGWCLETSTGFLSSPGGLLSMAPPGASPVRQQGLCYFFFFCTTPSRAGACRESRWDFCNVS